jgi:hypothetical protein
MLHGAIYQSLTTWHLHITLYHMYFFYIYILGIAGLIEIKFTSDKKK